jgi:hypothetical protein
MRVDTVSGNLLPARQIPVFGFLNEAHFNEAKKQQLLKLHVI